ncbi:radical SAM family heme chaperone HemW [Marinovum sp. 2_MG-2023]|uniref:radical SAM family heme chaperone HemW n=1 Tax=unclassified Marinovum TaxID=2647166 RepID=UPI0026E4727C|nr:MULTISPECIES: radical SAM family heme chaperone HemW [unclassified Marinovum]MDO6729813.1 radical SAM family heme chaperone HemW [Marinovum sp. 2_MG-2023]MDO6779627.1 radical SAM family heme chaperone HemW [Marinovum sp. 1_MG-2023]
MTEDWQLGGFGLYLHWPFCEAKCPYCDFNSHVTRRIDHEAWTAAYLTEIDRVAAETPDRILRSVYFGGGTPSLMQVSTVGAILERIAARWTLANDVEITLEANPSSVEAARFAGFRDAGVNRVSLGVQALNDPDLKRLGRLHDLGQAEAAIEIAQTTFDRMSFDLIYARQDQSIDDWRAELQRALDMGASHLSLYQLTIEDGTAFGDRFRAGKLRGLPQDDIAADMYEVTQEMCSAAGLPAYEVSNHARSGQESRHNLIYWRGGDYAGIGPGAHGRLTLQGQRWATEARRNPGAWLNAVKENDAEQRDPLSLQDIGLEYLMMGLRTIEPLDLDRLERRTGLSIPSERLESLVSLGVLTHHDRQIAVTAAGRPVLNAVIGELIRDFS